MTWKLYALLSGGAFLATYAVSLGPDLPPQAAVESQAPPPVVVDQEVQSDFVEQTERLRARLAEVAAYKEPERNVFSFRAPVAAPAAHAPASAALEAPVTPAAVPRPAFSLAGIATDVVNGVTERTAILTSLRGVVLARPGDVVDGGYRIVRVEEEAVVVALPGESGEHVTIGLSGSNGPLPLIP